MSTGVFFHFFPTFFSVNQDDYRNFHDISPTWMGLRWVGDNIPLRGFTSCVDVFSVASRDVVPNIQNPIHQCEAITMVRDHPHRGVTGFATPGSNIFKMFVTPSIGPIPLPPQQSFRTSIGSKTSAKSWRWQFERLVHCYIMWYADIYCPSSRFAKCNHILSEMDCLDQPHLSCSWDLVSYKFLSVRSQCVIWSPSIVDVWTHRLQTCSYCDT